MAQNMIKKIKKKKGVEETKDYTQLNYNHKVALRLHAT